MANSIEWAHTESGTEVVAPGDLDPDDRRLDPEFDPWGAAIFAGDGVAVYADSPEQLLAWLDRCTVQVREIISTGGYL